MANITPTDKLITLSGLDAFRAKILQQISASAYDDADVRGLITANTNKINTLNGNSTTSGSVDYKIAQAKTDITEQINAAVSSVYKPKGSIAFASLPALSSVAVGDVYNVTDAFTTTADFVDGASKKYPAGTNVVCIDVSGAKKWDALSGITDLSEYCTMEFIANTLSSYPTTDSVSGMVETAKQEAVMDAASQTAPYIDSAVANTISIANEYTDTAVANCVKYSDVTLATTTEIEALFT